VECCGSLIVATSEQTFSEVVFGGQLKSKCFLVLLLAFMYVTVSLVLCHIAWFVQEEESCYVMYYIQLSLLIMLIMLPFSDEYCMFHLTVQC